MIVCNNCTHLKMPTSEDKTKKCKKDKKPDFYKDGRVRIPQCNLFQYHEAKNT